MTLLVDDLKVYYRTLRGRRPRARRCQLRASRDGEIMGLAGESGCGKSTLGNSLIRLDAPDAATSAATSTLDGAELPIWDADAMNAFRFKHGLDRPAVRDERAEPDAQDRRHDRRPARGRAA